VHPRSTSTANLETEVARFARERDEAREQQAATNEILRVIASSPTNVQPVFDAIVRSAVKLCNGVVGAVNTFDGELTHVVAVQLYTRSAGCRATNVPNAAKSPTAYWASHSQSSDCPPPRCPE
jgi:hypothetical protein